MPCRTIAVANQKGGTGKTATTLSLGIAIAHRGKRVLLRAVSAAKAPSVGASIFAYDGRGKVASAFERLAEEVVCRG